jgi:uroporphyrin-III C-methyltransferase
MLGALVVSVATFWKTVLYFLVELCGHLNYTKHVLDAGDTKGFLAIVIAPNAVWLVMPALVIVTLLRRLRLRYTV